MADGYLPPASEDPVGSCHLEQVFLAACLFNGAIFRDLPEGFGPDHLAYENHGEIFEAARAAAGSGAGLLAPSVEAMLPHLAGPAGYIRSLAHSMLTARVQDAVGYATALMEVADRRALCALADEIKGGATAPDERRQPNAAIVAKAADGLERIASGQRQARPAMMFRDALDGAIRAGEDAAERNGGLAGLSSGFGCIDDRLGGMEPGCLYVMGARPAMGKTGLAVQIGLRVASTGVPVAFFSLEMNAAQIGRRALSLVSGIGIGGLKRAPFAPGARTSDVVVQARQRLADLPMLIEDEAALKVPAMAVRAKQARRTLGGIGLLIVDHLHIVGRPDSAARHGDTQAITEISGGLKRLAHR